MEFPFNKTEGSTDMRMLAGFVLFSVSALHAATVTYLTAGLGVDALPISNARVSGDEFQQVYSYSLFSSTNTIYALAFSSSAHTGGTDSATLSGSASITLSTTATLSAGSPGSWSLSNEGADKLVVFSGAFTTAVRHNSTFDITFEFSTPFVYDPSAGNLLVDFAWLSTPTTDGTLGLSASYGSTLVGSNSRTAQYGNFGAANTGVATQFTITPEPQSWLLASTMLLGLSCLVRRRKHLDIAAVEARGLIESPLF